MLTLRALEPDDARLMYEIENDASAREYSSTTAPLSMEQLRTYALTYDADPFHAGQLRLVAAKADGSPVGLADLYDIDAVHRHAFVGIYILPDYRGMGLGTEALRLLASYAGEVLGLACLGAKVSTANGASRSLFEKAGYRHCGTLPGWLRHGRRRAGLALYALPLDG